jgi:hypothetical protein
MENEKEWLDGSPLVIRVLESNQAEYIPIGQVEQDLDEYTGGKWGTSDFVFQIIKTGSYWFADASVMLEIPDRPPMIGAVTFPINSNDANMDYSGTALSFCIANAAKKLGIRFGRALNGRLDKGETGVPITQIKNDFEPDEKTDMEFEEIKKNLNDYEFYDDAKAYLDTTSFRHTMEAKIIVNNKKRKQDETK